MMNAIKIFLNPEIFFQNIFVIVAFRILFLVIFIQIINSVFKFLEHKTAQKIKNGKQEKQFHTLMATLRSIVNIVISVLFILEVLPKFGIDIRPILTAAGVLGVAVGFGSKQLVEDIISGMFLIIQGEILVGDYIEIDGKSGVVENLNLKRVSIRDLEGKVYYIRNGMINMVINHTRDFAYAVTSIGVSYNSDIDKVMNVITNDINEELKNGIYANQILSDIEMLGIDNFADSAIELKFRVKTKTLQQWAVKRELHKILKKQFDKHGIEIPFPQRVLHIEKE
jgi:small conductance mechanosensitive channel